MNHKQAGSTMETRENDTRPAVLPVLEGNIPGELKRFSQWVTWKLELRDGRWTKPPFQVDGQRYAMANDPRTWGSFMDALLTYEWQPMDGIGFEPTAELGIVFTDIDHCVDPDTGELAPWAIEIIERFHTYTERSPIDGVRIIARGSLPCDGKKKGGIEVYSAKHYLTLTGQKFEGKPTTIEPCQDAIDWLLETHFKEPEKPKSKPNSGNGAWHPSDDELLVKAFAARNREKLKRLFEGDTSGYPSQSEADLALCSLLAFWTDDPAQVDRIFRRSGLMREKWDKKDGVATYGERTIEKAFADRTEHYESRGDATSGGKNKGWSAVRINVTNQDLPRITKLAWDALSAANDPPQVFRHGSLAARIETDDHGYPIIREMTEHRMRHRLARVASWYAIKGKGKNRAETPTKPPIDVVRDVLATPDFPLPVLSHIVEAPIFASDGTLQTEPGYHPRTQNYYAPAAGFVIPCVPEQPSASEVKRARELITEDLLGDFPFTSEAEKAHAVGLFLLSFARNLIDGPTPLHLIEKPTAGTGASLLIDVLSRVATGHTAPVMTEARDEDEWRKRITAKLRGGPSIILIDNVSRRLDSAALSAAITSLVWTDRILGYSEDARIPVRCAWVATGNNPIVSSEIARRIIRIRLDAKLDRPWRRDAESFRHPDLRSWVTDHWAELVWSALTLVQGWLVAGKPVAKELPTLGGFEHWAQVIGSILEVSEIAGFLKNLSDFYEASDAEGKIWRMFVAAWWERFQEKIVGVSELFEVATGLDEPFDLGDKGDRSQKIRFGKLLAKARDRQFTLEVDKTSANLRIVSAGEKDRAGQWKLEKLERKLDPWD